MVDRKKIARDFEALAKDYGWVTREFRTAGTGTIYLELVRDGREWVVIRFANHKQVYHRWLTTYSVSPGNMDFDEVVELLRKPFGEVGDVLL